MIWAALPLAWRAGMIVLAVVAITGGIGGCVFKIKHDAVVAERAKIEQEKQDAINKAKKAVDILRDRCRADPATCVPDDWFRD